MSLLCWRYGANIIHLRRDYHLLVVGVILISLKSLVRAMYRCFASQVSSRNSTATSTLNMILSFCIYIGVS